MSAVNLASLAPVIHAQHGRIVGVGVELTAIDEFLEETKWPFDLLIDEKREVYNALNLKKHGCSSCWGICICCNSVGSWFKKAETLGYSNNAAGNWTQYGGTMLLGAGNGACLYLHKQSEDDFEPNLETILEALHATAEDRQRVVQYPSRMQ